MVNMYKNNLAFETPQGETGLFTPFQVDYIEIKTSCLTAEVLLCYKKTTYFLKLLNYEMI